MISYSRNWEVGKYRRWPVASACTSTNTISSQKKFTFALSSPDVFLFDTVHRRGEIWRVATRQIAPHPWNIL